MTNSRRTNPLPLIHRALGISTDYARTYGVKPHREATRLVSIGRAPDDDRTVRLVPHAAAAWHRMREVATDNGVVLLPLSGFRSIKRQTEIIREKLSSGQRLNDILRLVAAPGFSEHHTGRALDIVSTEYTALDEEFAQTAAFRWLECHAGDFSFTLSYPRSNRHGIAYEPWHWCWQP